MTAFDLILDITSRKPSKRGGEMCTWNLSKKQVTWLRGLCTEAATWGEQWDGSSIGYSVGGKLYNVNLKGDWYVFSWYPNGAGHITKQPRGNF